MNSFAAKASRPTVNFCYAVFLCYVMLTVNTNYYPKENERLSHYNTNCKLCDVGIEGLCIKECQILKKEGLVS